MQSEYFFTQEQLSIINGSLLGDGHLTKIKNKKSAFCKNQCGKHNDYLYWHFEKLKPYSNYFKEGDNWVKGKKYKRVVFRTLSNEFFGSLRNKWYCDNKKIIPSSLELNPLIIAIWFFDDGSNYLKKRCCKFSTECFSQEDCNFLIRQLSYFNIESYLTKRKAIQIKAKSYKAFIDLIAPYMLWKCFEHKIQYRDSELDFTTDAEAIKIFEQFDAGKSQRQIAKEMGKSYSVISAILRGCRKKHLNLSIAKPGLSLNNSSGFCGVSWDKERQKWLVSIKFKNKNLFLGRFNTKEEAIQAKLKWTEEKWPIKQHKTF